MKPYNVFQCILRIRCSLNLLVSYVRFDICGGIERASSRGHRARMQSVIFIVILIEISKN